MIEIKLGGSFNKFVDAYFDGITGLSRSSIKNYINIYDDHPRVVSICKAKGKDINIISCREAVDLVENKDREMKKRKDGSGLNELYLVRSISIPKENTKENKKKRKFEDIGDITQTHKKLADALDEVKKLKKENDDLKQENNSLRSANNNYLNTFNKYMKMWNQKSNSTQQEGDDITQSVKIERSDVDIELICNSLDTCIDLCSGD